MATKRIAMTFSSSRSESAEALDVRMDYLPFIDDESDLQRYEDAVERSIGEESQKNKNGTHPEAQHMLPTELRSNPIHSLHCETPYEDERLLQEYQKSFPRVELERYTLQDHTDVDALCVMDSYLRHQELVLERLMPQTLLNQWAINNDFLDASSSTLQKVIDDQQTNILNLNTYRKTLQEQNRPRFADLEEQWKSSLLDRLNVE